MVTSCHISKAAFHCQIMGGRHLGTLQPAVIRKQSKFQICLFETLNPSRKYLHFDRLIRYQNQKVLSIAIYLPTKPILQFIFSDMESSAGLVHYTDLLTPRDPVDIVFEDIKYAVDIDLNRDKLLPTCTKKTQRKQILKGISGMAKAGEVTALMGSSGAGKTTLLNIIASRVAHSSVKETPGVAHGKIYANDLQYTYRQFGDFANYVMQHDILLETLTVRETLDYVAGLRLARSKADRRIIVDQIIIDLKLEKCVDAVIGGANYKGISGGQRKRTSIAFQLMSDPKVLMLDEPTSGLDSLTAFVICSFLRKISRLRNLTILMTIHQPNSETFQLFDRLLLMVDGRAIYQGAANQAIHYFKRMGFPCPEFSNPPDYFMSIMHQDDKKNVANYPKYFQQYNKQLASAVSKQIAAKHHFEVTISHKKIPYCQTLHTIVRRDFLNALRNPVVFRTRLFISIILGLLIGGVYFNLGDNYIILEQGQKIAGIDFYSLAGLLFFMSMTGFMSSLTPVTIVFPKERAVFLKEQGSRLYSTLQFALSRNIVEIPYLIFIPLIWALIMYWMVGLASTAAQFFTFYFIFFWVSFAGNSLGLLLGSIITSTTLITIMVPVFTLPFVIFSGFYKNTADLPKWIGWIQYISPMKYSFIAFIRNEFKGLSNDDLPVSFLNFQRNLTLWASIGILIGIGFFFRIISILFLYFNRTKLQ